MGDSTGNPASPGHSVGTPERHVTISPLTWLTDKPVTVEKWPLSKDKLSALESLVEEQLSKGNIVPSNSP